MSDPTFTEPAPSTFTPQVRPNDSALDDALVSDLNRMSSADHLEMAEAAAQQADLARNANRDARDVTFYVGMAQVHATLALFKITNVI